MSPPEHYINGKWVIGSGVPWTVHDPATGLVAWQGKAANVDEVNRACLAARAAFRAWATTTLDDRIALCRKFQALLMENAELLRATISAEVGKPMWEAQTEVDSMVAKVKISIEAQAIRAGESSAPVADGKSVVRHRPHGVVAVLGPYNFPGHLPNGHIVPALLAGNTIVFKPSEYAPQTALATTKLWEQAGMPAGVLNLVNGGRDTGSHLAKHAALNGILFTGSRQVGQTLHRQFAGQPEKMLALEMGGNNPLVVWQVQNLDAAVYHALFSAFVSAGQRCTCARRIIVENGPNGQAFIDRLVGTAARLRVGAGNAPAPSFMGPVISDTAANQLLAAQKKLLAHGGVSLLAMRQLKPGTGLLSPGIVDVTDLEILTDEEWFGPLTQVMRVKNFAAAIDAANATSYGLAAGLLSDEPTYWQQFLQTVRAGVVNWNRPTTGAASIAPFGGIGYSGNHRPSAYYAADYCAYPVASIESATLEMPASLAPGISLPP